MRVTIDGILELEQGKLRVTLIKAVIKAVVKAVVRARQGAGELRFEK
ncbi:MAG TPA: hypothetical protein VKP61_18305 [Candidatus Acidoferrum sp.]|nr:hypothetical protein [Candidatus Acidoferrum sp.]